MLQEIEAGHVVRDGAPAGGLTTATGLAIHWQDGPLGRGAERVRPNGAFVETVIAAALDRLAFYQTTRFACEDNATAIECLDSALAVLHHRTTDREARGVEGTHEV